MAGHVQNCCSCNSTDWSRVPNVSTATATVNMKFLSANIFTLISGAICIWAQPSSESESESNRCESGSCKYSTVNNTSLNQSIVIFLSSLTEANSTVTAPEVETVVTNTTDEQGRKVTHIRVTETKVTEIQLTWSEAEDSGNKAPGCELGQLNGGSTEAPPLLPLSTDPPTITLPPSTSTENGCSEEGFFPHPTNCMKFRRCVSLGDPDALAEFIFDCAGGTDLWCQSLLTCSFVFQCPEPCPPPTAPPNGEESVTTVVDQDEDYENELKKY